MSEVSSVEKPNQGSPDFATDSLVIDHSNQWLVEVVFPEQPLSLSYLKYVPDLMMASVASTDPRLLGSLTHRK